MVTAVAQQSFARDGFLLLPRVFDRAELDAIGSLTPALEGCGRVVDLRDDEGRSSPLVTGVAAGDCPELLELVSANRLAGVARSLLGDDVLHLETRVSVKAPDSGEWHWHQEFRYWHGRGLERPAIVSAMVYLDHADAVNGCLQLLPGSHGAGLLPHRPKGGQEAVPDEIVAALARRSPPRFAAGPSGAVLFFAGNTLHASARNRSRRARRAVLITYNATSNGAVGERLDGARAA